ncbi:methyltransferase domain-containing protein [Haloferax larsenii]|uniref:Demethylmenaquinone methyltransferase / 2-methoxy-6-polyprenyl-1,4-benzoquinol methylase n=1 Tax=Haloferax larsenii TaxID=302484 RepID=A0A1H7R6A7_HALLR|nr:methyltransferase domain-containing protein [Haloferax larsenii]SEL55464.1 demethylmenaquinone methyltransferase / 2-methoxy-6-polyprenyl-1,4-benzoquinol methylase [Haloferax larsenii]
MTDADRGRRLYDWWSRHQGVFRFFSRLFLPGQTHLRERARAALALDSGDVVLDVGCGPGVNFDALRAAVGDEGTVLGLDYSDGMTVTARERIERDDWANVHVVRADAARLPLCTSFDAAYATLSLSSMANPKQGIDSVYDALAPGGRFVVFDARPFPRLPLSLLNPLFNPLSKAATNWHPEHDLCSLLDARFDSVRFTDANAGTLFVAVATKHDADGRPRRSSVPVSHQDRASSSNVSTR